MAYPEDIISVILAVILGGAIGLERELRGKVAGLRTNILICLGAAIFTIISRKMGGQETSITRIAAGIVTGVGFLGAGAIIHGGDGIHGLTSAATIWIVASIGMACGAGFSQLAILSSLVVLVVLIGLAPIEQWVNSLKRKYKVKSDV